MRIEAGRYNYAKTEGVGLFVTGNWSPEHISDNPEETIRAIEEIINWTQITRAVCEKVKKDKCPADCPIAELQTDALALQRSLFGNV